MRLRVLALTALVVALAAVPVSAFASTTIGDVESTPGPPGPPGSVYIQTVDPAGHTYAVPAGGGVVTSLSAWIGASSPATARILVVRPSGLSSFTVVGGGTVSTTGTGAYDKQTVATRIAVQAGDRLAGAAPSSGGASIGATNVSGTVRFGTSAVPADGATIDTSSGFSDQTNVAMSFAAVVEPDADHDGYGDETQDACPADPAIHAGACTTDLKTTATATPASITQGDVSTIVATIENVGAGPATAATATLGLPAGVQVVAASTTAGECTGTTCALGDVPPGASRKVFLVVRGTAAGAQAVAVTAATTSSDVAHDNDAATATITVTAPPTITTPQPPQIKLCTVPSLVGKTAKQARQALLKAQCAAGRITGSKSAKARVRTQTIPKGIQVVAGTKVGMKLVAPKKRHG